MKILAMHVCLKGSEFCGFERRIRKVCFHLAIINNKLNSVQPYKCFGFLKFEAN